MIESRFAGTLAAIVALAAGLALFGVHSSEDARARSVANDPSLARPAAVRYVQALAHHRSVAGMEAPAGPADARSLAALHAWLARIPVADLRLTAYDADAPAGRVRVILSMHATLGAAPASVPLDLGERELELRPAGGMWVVSADETADRGVVVPATGLGAITGARYWLGERAIVIDATGDPSGAALARDTADQYAPFLQARYGGGRAIERPVVFILPDASTAEQIGGVIGFDEAVGEEKHGLVFINHPEWLRWSGPGERGVVVHELTHVASRAMLVGAPESLVEGLARYEESAALDERGWGFRLQGLVDAYDAGYPTMARWRNVGEDMWGLSDGGEQGLAYMDGYAMTHVIMRDYGGVAAVRALAVAYGQLVTGPTATPRQVRRAFMRALHVPFSRVVGEAHAFAESQV
jgi:hypothetical protein